MTLMFLSLIISVVPSGASAADWPMGYEEAKANGTPSPYGHSVQSIGTSLPVRSQSAYSSMDLVVSGDLIQRRYFDSEGKV